MLLDLNYVGFSVASRDTFAESRWGGVCWGGRYWCWCMGDRDAPMPSDMEEDGDSGAGPSRQRASSGTSMV